MSDTHPAAVNPAPAPMGGGVNPLQFVKANRKQLLIAVAVVVVLVLVFKAYKAGDLPKLPGVREGLTAPVPAPHQTGPYWGQYALGADAGFGPVSQDSCNLAWNPAAVAEAQALGSVGSYPHTQQALAPLQDAVDAGSGLKASNLSDSDLAQLAQTGAIA